MKIRRIYIVFLIPFVFAGGVNLWLKIIYHRYPVVQVRIDLGTLNLFFGVLLSILLIAWYVQRQSLQRKILQVEKETLALAKHEQHQFIRRLDHELKNPLLIIKTGLALLSAEFGEVILNLPDQESISCQNKHLEEIVNRIDQQVQRLASLISNLRKLSDLEVRQLEMRQVNLNVLLENLVQDFSREPSIGNREIHLSLPTTPFQLSEICADEDLIYVSFHNIIDNAIKFTQVDGLIEIRAFENHRDIIIEIADNGIGIPEDQVDIIWGDLFRAENAMGIPGSGLGLSMVKTIIRRHQGDISVRSQIGAGSVFVIRLSKK